MGKWEGTFSTLWLDEGGPGRRGLGVAALLSLGLLFLHLQNSGKAWLAGM